MSWTTVRTAVIATLAAAALLTAGPAAADPPYSAGEPCNADRDCAEPLACLRGVCAMGECQSDAMCGPLEICVAYRSCEPVECKRSDHCPGSEVCDTSRHECVDCLTAADCGAGPAICDRSRCVSVECTTDGHCDPQERCSGRSCEPRCAGGDLWVAASGGCSGCVSPRSGSVCSNDFDCPVDARCGTAPGVDPRKASWCVPRCGLRDDIRRLRREIDALDTMPVRIIGTPGPDCPDCSYSFDLTGVRSVLERAKLGGDVEIHVVDDRRRTLVDFGRQTLSGGGFPTLTSRVSGVPAEPIRAGSTCGYRLVVTDSRGQSLADTSLCVAAR